MGERRKRKSLWDKEAETRPFTGMSEYHNWIGKEKHPSHDSYYQNMSPEFKYNHSLDNDRSHSHRYPGRARSRSRSRSRTRGRSRSRSLSRGMERERARGGSRSRSRSDSDTRGWIRSRSPLGDYKHQSSGWSDRRSLPEKSTEICSDFASGRCRRGSQCKYSHPKNTGHRDGGLGGVDTSESRRSWADYSRGPWTESRGDVSDSYHGEDEQFQNNSKNAVPCRNFIKGNCRWGDTCRFSHHVASDETSVEGAKHSSSDKDAEHQPYRNRNPPCKYFAVGKCDRDNCRFSHEDSQFNSLESRRDKVINNDRSSRDKGSRRSGLRWDDAGRISDDVKLSGRNSSVVTVTDSITDYSDSRHNNKVDQRFSSNAWQQNVSQVSHIQHQNHGVEENNPVSSFHSDVIDDVKDSRNTTDPVFLFGQNLHQNGENVLPRHLTIPEEAGSEEMSALNGAETHQVANLDLQSQIQKLQMKGMSETNTSLSFPSLATGEHSTQYTSSLLFTALQHVTNPVMFPNPILENEHSGKNAVAEVSDTTGMVLSIENGRSSNEHGNHMGEGNKMASIAGTGPNNSEIDHSRRAIVQQETAPENPEFDEFKGGIGELSKGVQDGKHSETLDGLGKADEYANKDDKGMRLFKNSLVEFVKDILKPTWKEGRMSREVHKTIVKKVVDKITSTIQTEHIPKTQEKAEQYLSFSKPKIARLVQAYVDRSSKTDS